MGPSADQVQQVVREALGQFQKLAASDQPPTPVISQMLEVLVRTTGAHGAAAWMPTDTDAQSFKPIAVTGKAKALVLTPQQEPHAAVAHTVAACWSQTGKAVVIGPGQNDFQSTDLFQTSQFYIAVESNGRMMGVVQLICGADVDPKVYREYAAFAQQAATAIGQYLSRRQSRVLAEDANRSAGVLRIVRQLAEMSDPRDMCHELANLARSTIGAQRLAVVDFFTNRPRVVFADVIETNKKAVVVRAVERLAEAAHQRQVPMTFTRGQDLTDDDEALAPLLDQLFDMGNAQAVCLTPVRRGENIIAVLVAEYGKVEDVGRLAPAQQEIATQAGPLIGRALDFQSRPLRRISDWLWQIRLKPRRFLSRSALTIISLGALVYLFFFVPAPLHLRVDARLEPQTVSTLTAPLDGRIKKVHVRSGQPVEAGQLLVEFEDIDYQTKKRELEKAIASRNVMLQEARQQRVASAIAGFGLQVEELRLQLKQVERLIEKTRLTAPISGVVLTDRPEDLLEQTVPVGQGLLQLGDLKQFELVMEVDEADMALIEGELRAGREVSIVYLSRAYADYPQTAVIRPDQRQALSPTTIAVPNQQQHVFRITIPIELQGFDEQLALANPTGRAKLRAGTGSIAYRFGRRAWHFIKMTLLF